MAYVKNRTTGSIITPYVTLNKTQSLTLINQTSIDGTEYLTRFGSPVYSYELELYVNRQGRDMLMTAFDSLYEIEVKVQEGTFAGRIKELNKFDQVYYGWYKVKVVLSALNEVNSR